MSNTELVSATLFALLALSLVAWMSATNALACSRRREQNLRRELKNARDQRAILIGEVAKAAAGVSDRVRILNVVYQQGDPILLREVCDAFTARDVAKINSLTK